MRNQSKGRSSTSAPELFDFTGSQPLNKDTENNIQGQLFDDFVQVPYTGVPTPTEGNIPISEDDSKNIEVVIADVEVETQYNLGDSCEIDLYSNNKGKGIIKGLVEGHESSLQIQEETNNSNLKSTNKAFIPPPLIGATEPTDSIFQSVTATELREIVANEPPVKNLITPLIREKEATILFAGTGLGKSIFAMQIAIAVAKGEDLYFSDSFRLLNECVAQMVLYYDFELSNDQIVKRWGKEEINDNLIISKLKRGRPILETDPTKIFQLLKNEADKNNCKVIIIDNISKIGNRLEETENAVKFMNALWVLAKDEGYSILVVAHTPKRNRQLPITVDSLAGSSKLAALCDAIFAINEVYDEEGDKRYIIQLKARNGKAEYGKSNVICTKIDTDPITGQVKHFFQELMTETEALTGVISKDYKFEEKKEAAVATLLYGSLSKAEEQINVSRSTIQNRHASFQEKYPKEYRELKKMSSKELNELMISLKSNEK